MKIVLERTEINSMLKGLITEKYKRLIGNDQISEITGLDNNYSRVEITLITPEEIEAEKEA